MTEQAARAAGRAPGVSASGAPAVHAGGFRLMRYFTMATLAAFAAVALALYFLQRMEETFFEQVQREQGAFFARAQAELARQHAEAARASLMAVHEAGHLNMTRLVANMLWETDFGPFVAKAQRIAVEPCRALPARSDAGAADARRACFAAIGRRLMDLPGFKALDGKAYAAMRASTVFKVKVFDLRGITLYSSEHAQIGEDALDNAGWRSAAQGRHASELTHRDRFSAFERVVEDRDLISTYVPVRAAGRNEVIGVFEIYSDVTPFLEQIKIASRRFAEITAGNEASVARTARLNQQAVGASSDRFLVIVGGLLALLYAASLLIVRNGQRIIDRQTLAQEQAARREQLWHREKMAALAAMAANVSHEVGNPLAIISGLVEDLAAREPAGELVAGHSKLILEQTARIATMTRQISDFAAAPGEAPEWVDVNAMVKAVCDFQNFDRRFGATPIEFRPDARLPARRAVPDHLNEVMRTLLQAWVASAPESGRCTRLRVGTALHGDEVRIRIGGDAEPAVLAAIVARLQSDARFDSARRRVQEMGGRLSTTEAAVEIALPPAGADAPATSS